MTDISLLHRDLDSLISLPDDEAAEMLNLRMRAWDMVDRLHERSYVERGIIVHEFRQRKLWTFLGHENFSAWMASGFTGCRSVNYEAERDVIDLSDVAGRIGEVPKANIKTLRQLSSQVRQMPEIIEAARTLPNDEFLEKIEQEHPDQHMETRKRLRFNPERSGAEKVEQAIQFAIDNGIATNRDDALVRMAEYALEGWEQEEPFDPVAFGWVGKDGRP